MFQVQVGGGTLRLSEGDITKSRAEAMVNAANSRLAGGGGVDGAIHRAGGPDIMAECRALGHCPTGEAVITTAGNLSAKKVIHTVGPVWRGGDSGEDDLLASCYRKSFELARKYNLQSIAFPAISTGVYGFPKQPAARIAIRETLKELAANRHLAKVIFVCFNRETRVAYEAALEEESRP